MAKAVFDVGIASETKQFEQGIRTGMVEPLEDAEQALTDLGKNKGPEQLERDLEDAQDQTENLRKEIKRTADQIEDDFRSSSKAAKRFGDDAGEATTEFKNEARQNFSEVTSSFKGDMDSITDLAQGTLGGIAGTLAGPLAFAAGGAAVGVGLIGSAIEGLVDSAEQTKERVTEKFREMAQAGLEEWSSAQAVIDRLTDIWGEHSEEVKRASDELGLAPETVAAAWAGSEQAIAQVESRYDTLLAKAKELEQTNEGEGRGAVIQLEHATQGLRSAMDEIDQAKTKATELADIENAYLKGVLESAQAASLEIDVMNNKLFTLPDGQQILIEADTGRATTDLEDFKGDLDGIAQRVTTTTLRVDEPDVDDIVRNLQRRLNYRSLSINVRAVLPNGEPVL